MEATPNLKLFEVGGCVRDDLLGLPVKDVDFSVEAPSFEAMIEGLEAAGFQLIPGCTKPEFLTVRGKVPAGSPLRDRTDVADFVMCRADGPTADGRRPEFVTPGTIMDDLARRDFTVNAIARRVENGNFIDPFDGSDDLVRGILRFVGNPMDRIREDGLRVLRGFRFMVTKGLTPERDTREALVSEEAADMLQCVSVERVREEIDKMFRADTLEAMRLLSTLPEATFFSIFRDGLRVMPTLKK